MATEKTKPAQTFRHGIVNAAVWEITGKDKLTAKERSFYTVTFSRSFQNLKGKWLTSKTIGHDNIEDLVIVAMEAKLWISSDSN